MQSTRPMTRFAAVLRTSRCVSTSSRLQQSSAPSTSTSTSNSNSFKSNPRHFDSLAAKHSPNTVHYNLVDNPSIAFTVRPPPSVTPPTLPATSSTSQEQQQQHLPPRLHPARPTEDATKRLDVTEIQEMQALRLSNPSYWTRSRLAEKYQVSKFFVAIQGFGESIEGKAAEKMVNEAHAQRGDRQRGRWGFKKRVDREVRRRRKELW